MPDPATREVWSRANIGEIFRGVVTPLSWDVFLPLLQRAAGLRAWLPWALHWRWRLQNGQPAQPQPPRLFDGRAYMELSASYQSFAGLPGVTPRMLQRVLGFPMDALPPEDLPRKTAPAGRLHALRKAVFWTEILGITPGLRVLAGLARRRAQKDARLKTADELTGLLAGAQRLQKRAAPVFALHLSCTGMAFSALGLLHERLCRVMPEPAADALETALLTGAAQISSAQFNMALWDVAQQPDTDTLVGQSAAWQRFLDRFGARGSDEFELASPFWCEDLTLPAQIVGAMRADRGYDPRIQARQHWEQSCGQVRQALAMARAHGGVGGWLIADALAKSYTRLVGWRENLKHVLIGYFYAMRQGYLAVGRMLAVRGQIKTPDDVFFLTQSELGELSDSAEQNAHVLVAARRAQHQQDAAKAAFDVWVWDGAGFAPRSAVAAATSDVLQGTPCSPGRVRAPAFLYHDGVDASQMPDGCILVMASVDPGLTILFGRAAGLITEMGGLLSHGATVARELGLPAVMGVPRVLERIRSGQIVMLDGAAGMVQVGAAEANGAGDGTG